jgi:hypothetical protein
MLASEVMDEAASLMNDTGKLTWGYPQLLPYLQRAYRTLELNLFLNGVRSLKEVSAIIPVDPMSAEVVLPQDFVQPISMGERAAGSNNGFVPVTEAEWDLAPQSDAINFWNWREDTLKISAPKQAREVFLRYRKGLTVIQGENSNITLPMSKSYLSAKTAANASAFGAANMERAAVLNTEANDCLSMLINSEIRNQQGLKFRRKPYGYSRRARRGF